MPRHARGKAGFDGCRAGLETDHGFDRDLSDRYCFLDGFPPERFDADLLGGRQHGLERDGNDLEFDQSVLDHRADISARLVLGISRQTRQRTLDTDENGDRNDADRAFVFRALFCRNGRRRTTSRRPNNSPAVHSELTKEWRQI